MKTEIALRRRAVALYLQGRKKSEIARLLQRSRPWVDRWIDRYRAEAPRLSLQDRSRAPKQRRCAYAERIKGMVVQIRQAREQGQRAKYRYALLGAQAIYYELQELGISPLPSSRTIHRWLKRAGRIPERRKHPIPPTRYCPARQ
jgi:transposase